MSFLPEISIPASATYYSFVDKTKTYNSNHDIIWSFNFLLSNTNLAQTGICTFLTPLSNNTNSIQPGHYLGTAKTGDTSMSLLSNGSTRSVTPFGVIRIAFDSTGYYALSTSTRTGVSLSNVKQNALIIRDCDDNLLLNSSLNSTEFVFNNNNQIIQCLYSNLNRQLTVSYKSLTSTDFSTLTSIELPFNIINDVNTDNLRVGLSYCSPVSTTSTSKARMLLYSLSTDGVEKNVNISSINTDILS
jgi:hypothetical protein